LKNVTNRKSGTCPQGDQWAPGGSIAELFHENTKFHVQEKRKNAPKAISTGRFVATQTQWAADQRVYGVGTALEVYTQTDLEQKLEAVTRLDSEVFQQA
jgi:hypothetical protein